jgi:hypothetical protein
MSDFVIEYNSITNRNKNIFYFKHYTEDIDEFKDWIHYNNICVDDFQDLCESFRNIYLDKKRKDIIERFIKCNSSDNGNNKLYKLYLLYHDEYEFMQMMNDEIIIEIYNYVNLMKDIYNRFKRKNNNTAD